MHTVKLGGTLALTLHLGATLIFVPNFGTTFALARKVSTTFPLTSDNVITLVTFPFVYNYSITITTVIHDFIVHFFNGTLRSTLGQLQTPSMLLIGIAYSWFTTM